MAGGSNEVEQNVNTIITEPGVTLNSRLLGKNVVVLSLEETNDFRETLWESATVVQQ